MRKIIIVALVIGLTAGYVLAQKPTINANLAHYDITGSRLSGIADKRLSLVVLTYGSATIPCILMDAHPSALSNDVTNSAISCGWTAENVAAIGGK